MQWRTAGIFECIAWIQYRFLANHAGAAHFLGAAIGIGDFPITIAQLHGVFAAIFDSDMIGPNEIIVGRRRLIVQIRWFDRNADIVGGFAVHRAASYGKSTFMERGGKPYKFIKKGAQRPLFPLIRQLVHNIPVMRRGAADPHASTAITRLANIVAGPDGKIVFATRFNLDIFRRHTSLN